LKVSEKSTIAITKLTRIFPKCGKRVLGILTIIITIKHRVREKIFQYVKIGE